jgi:hypothetical protein
VNPPASIESGPDSTEPHRTCPVVALDYSSEPDLSGLRLASKEAPPNLSGGGTGLVQSTRLVWSETSFQRASMSF